MYTYTNIVGRDNFILMLSAMHTHAPIYHVTCDGATPLYAETE